MYKSYYGGLIINTRQKLDVFEMQKLWDGMVLPNKVVYRAWDHPISGLLESNNVYEITDDLFLDGDQYYELQNNATTIQIHKIFYSLCWWIYVVIVSNHAVIY